MDVEMTWPLALRSSTGIFESALALGSRPLLDRKSNSHLDMAAEEAEGVAAAEEVVAGVAAVAAVAEEAAVVVEVAAVGRGTRRSYPLHSQVR